MAAGSSTISSSWRALLSGAMESNSHLKHSTYFQFATVSTNGRPSNRTVVFRGFQEGNDKIQINTDTRSIKIGELRQCPFCEICWYFTGSWEQFRISGSVEVIDGSSNDPAKLMQREKSWFASSLKSRYQYLGPLPRLPILDGKELNKDIQLEKSHSPVETFCLLVVDPDQVDYLNLKSNERLMFSSSARDNNKIWTSERVNP